MINILTALWCEPWLISGQVHQQICKIVDAHISGRAHMAGGIHDCAETSTNGEVLELLGDVAIIKIEGVLGKHVSGIAKSSGVTDIEDIDAALATALGSSDIHGILLDVNSPGGAVIGLPELAAKIKSAAVKKPIVAFTDTVMASAAYWLAAGADAIYASQSALVGNIGVYTAFLDSSRKFEMEGLSMEVVKGGKYKGIGIPGIPFTAEERAKIQERVDQVYGWFTDHVKAYREAITEEALQGLCYSGDQAILHDLIDVVGTRDEALKEVKEMM